MVAREVGGGAVGACVGVLDGWRRDQLGRRKAVVAPMNSAGVGRTCKYTEQETADNGHLSAVRCEPSCHGKEETGGHRM